mgnify:CR=1 FL=1
MFPVHHFEAFLAGRSGAPRMYRPPWVPLQWSGLPSWSPPSRAGVPDALPSSWKDMVSEEVEEPVNVEEVASLSDASGRAGSKGLDRSVRFGPGRNPYGGACAPALALPHLPVFLRNFRFFGLPS